MKRMQSETMKAALTGLVVLGCLLTGSAFGGNLNKKLDAWTNHVGGQYFLVPSTAPPNLTSSEFSKLGTYKTQSKVFNLAAWEALQQNASQQGGELVFNSKQEFLDTIRTWDQYTDKVIDDAGLALGIGPSERNKAQSLVRRMFKPVRGALNVQIDHMPPASFLKGNTDSTISRPILEDVHQGVPKTAFSDGSRTITPHRMRTTGTSAYRTDIFNEMNGRLNTYGGQPDNTNHLMNLIDEVEQQHGTFNAAERAELREAWALSVNMLDSLRAGQETEELIILANAEGPGVLDTSKTANGPFWDDFLAAGSPTREADIRDALLAGTEAAALDAATGLPETVTDVARGRLSTEMRSVADYIVTGIKPPFTDPALEAFADGMLNRFRTRYPTTCGWNGAN